MQMPKACCRLVSATVIPLNGMMKDNIFFSRASRHWTTLIGIIGGFLFFILGLWLLLLLNKIAATLIFGISFSLMGFFVFAFSIDLYFIRPRLFVFQIDQDRISWGTKGQEREIQFHDLEQMNFSVISGIAGNIDFKLKNGDIIRYNNHTSKMLLGLGSDQGYGV